MAEIYTDEIKEDTPIVQQSSEEVGSGLDGMQNNERIINGAMTASSLDIPDITTASAFHVKTDGKLFGGVALANETNAIWSITPAGLATFANITITGGTIGGSVVANVGYVANSTADAIPTGLTVSSTAITTAVDGTTSAYVILTWTAISTNTFDYYKIRYKKATYTYYTFLDAKTNTITIEGLVPNVSYNFGIASVNKYGSMSAFSADISQTTASDTAAPATVTAGSATGGIQYVIVEWTHNTESDLASYNIYRNTTDNSGTATLIGNTRTNYFVDGNRTGGTIYYYWVKAVDTSGNVSASFSTVVSATPRDVGNTDVSSTAAIAASKILIDGTVYLSNWQKTGDLTKIDGGDISTGTVTLTQLNFTPVQTSNVIASINASAEGIRIDADNLTISAATTFSSGYDPTLKVDETGGSYDSAASGARVRIFPDANTGIQVIDNAAADVFKCIVGGTDVGDVIIGNWAGNQGVFYDKSAGTFTFKGALSAPTGSLGAITTGLITLDTTGYIKGGQTAYDTGTGFFLGYSTDAYKFSIGVGGSSPSLTWDGTTLLVKGKVDHIAGNVLASSANTERTSNDVPYTKYKEIAIKRGGILRIKFDLHGATGASAYGKVYKNGVAIGIEQTTTSATYTTFSEDISGWSADDLVQLYLKKGTDMTYAQNFRIYVLNFDQFTVNTD